MCKAVDAARGNTIGAAATIFIVGLEKTLLPRRLLGTHVSFSGEEDGGWVVEIDASPDGHIEPRRIRLRFQGVVEARLNNAADRTNSPDQVLCINTTSPWLSEFESSYIAQYGTKLLLVIKNVKHFVVHGHDLTIGLLARNIFCDLK